MEQYLTRKQVEKLTTLSRSTIYEEIAAGRFPRPVRISRRRVAWRERDIEAYLNGKRDWAEPLLKEAA